LAEEATSIGQAWYRLERREPFRPRKGAGVRGRLRPHCTLAVTAAFPVSVNVQVFVLFPPLEQAPDQMTSRLFVALIVIVVPVANDAEPLLPTATLMPAGLEVTRSPLRPVAVTVSFKAEKGEPMSQQGQLIRLKRTGREVGGVTPPGY
jgi:hypothetical protein